MTVLEHTSGENDLIEIHQYQMRRYISSKEAVWRIFNFPIHERHLTVIHLSFQLENGQSLLHDRKCHSTCPEEKTLPSLFRICTKDELAHNLLHNEVHKNYTWANGNKTWGNVENMGWLYQNKQK
ncbi:hypothetical protein AVEN_147353-1 [Araneus ventricosus]|uniref:Uncharacterized protein n=1 Tax=Araneus ventricosus TaxID=182803 RepID=A0A4Y1ZT72_ARAVE|nr:hypothetical protein AVEN_147353-1 [Araneus ventricosus]